MKPVFKQNIPTLHLYPFSLLNEIVDLRIGILTIREKWQLAMDLFPSLKIDVEIPDNLLPDFQFFEQLSLKPLSFILENSDLKYLKHPWDLIQYNADAIEKDYQLISFKNKSSLLPDSCNYLHKESIFIEEGAKIHALQIDASNGPVYIGKEALIMAGSIIIGPAAIGNKAIIKLGTYIYGGSSIGPGCTVGGEIKNSNIMDFSNKAHHGYLGDSVMGKWCNLGAGTSVSNIKNNASRIRITDAFNGLQYDVGQKCGMMMGDFSKSAINSSFNSGSIIGICSNIFNSGVLLPKYIPDFSWGVSNDVKYHEDKLIRDITQWMGLKKIEPDEILVQKIKKAYNQITQHEKKNRSSQLENES